MSWIIRNFAGKYRTHETIGIHTHTKTALVHPSSFTGKERDSETGFSYFGARYYDSDLSGLFLSIDPMAEVSSFEKRSGLLRTSSSLRAPQELVPYCAWNPLKLVDPNGEEALDNTDGWIIDRVNKTITRNDQCGGDNVQYVQGDGARIRNESRGDLLNEYPDYSYYDNVQSGS